MQPHAHLIPCHKQLRERDKRERKDEGKHTEEREGCVDTEAQSVWMSA